MQISIYLNSLHVFVLHINLNVRVCVGGCFTQHRDGFISKLAVMLLEVTELVLILPVGGEESNTAHIIRPVREK